MRSRLRPVARRILERAPLALFLLALAAGLIAYGIAIERHGIFPGRILDDAEKTARVTADSLQTPDDGEFRRFSDTTLDGFRAQRLEIVEGDSLASAVLVVGGRHQYRELCPEHGCLAVAIGPSGEVLHAWPFRPNAIHAANIADEDDYPHELNNFSVERDLRPFGVEQYPDGDLLVTFFVWNSFPYAGGVARIDRDGQPRWFRRDYSHHWPRLTDGDIALVPAFTISDGGPNGARPDGYPSCDGKAFRTVVNVLDGDGVPLERIPVLDIILASPGGAVLTGPANPCDPLHLNSIDVIGENAGAPRGVGPGDIVLSFRTIDAFAILDGQTHALKRIAHGQFRRQHDVTHLEGSRFLLFDNRGGRSGNLPDDGPSRLLMVDVDTGVETAVFPNDRTPDALRRLYTANEGAIDLSADRRRVAIAFMEAGVAVEVRLADGAVLAVHRALHDVSGLGQFPDERLERAALFGHGGMLYLLGDAWPEP